MGPKTDPRYPVKSSVAPPGASTRPKTASRASKTPQERSKTTPRPFWEAFSFEQMMIFLGFFNIFRKLIFFRQFRFRSHLEAQLESTWSPKSLLRADPGVVLVDLGAVLGVLGWSWGDLERSWHGLGRSSGGLGRSWEGLGPVWSGLRRGLRRAWPSQDSPRPPREGFWEAKMLPKHPPDASRAALDSKM